ncbi:hypothetical protein ACLJJ6_09685 [Pediococcus siamensis]|uniref:hypothetical protein n=1 Tax=Pediococcus siamensis TaxID=381829 RepID=UPI0039A38020
MAQRLPRGAIFFSVWLGLTILWGLRSISAYHEIRMPLQFTSIVILNFAPIIGIMVLLLMTLFRSRKLNLTALIFLILATLTSRPPIYLLSVSLFGVPLVLICNIYLSVIICNHDQPLPVAKWVAVLIGVGFLLCLRSPQLSARFAITGYADPLTAMQTRVTVNSEAKQRLKQNGTILITPKDPEVTLSGVGKINLKVKRIGFLYFSQIGNYTYEWGM